MRLSQLLGREHQAHHGTTPTALAPAAAASPLGTIRNSAVYPRPIEAICDGESVTVLATGDIVGMSPAFQIVGENGRPDWVSADSITFVQRDVLPQTEQQRSWLRNQQSPSSAYQGQT